MPCCCNLCCNHVTKTQLLRSIIFPPKSSPNPSNSHKSMLMFFPPANIPPPQFSKKISRPAVKNICLPPNPRPNLAKLNLSQNSIDCQKTCYWVLISDGEHVLLWNFVISSGFPHGHGSLASSGDHFYGSCDLKVPVA